MGNKDGYTEEGELFEDITDVNPSVDEDQPEDAETETDANPEKPFTEDQTDDADLTGEAVDSEKIENSEEESSEDIEDTSEVVDDYSDLTRPPKEHSGLIQSISWPGDRIDTSANERLLLAANPHPIKHASQYAASIILILITGFLSLHYLLGFTNDYLTSGGLPFGLVMELTTTYLLGLLGIMALAIGILIWIEITRQHTWYIVTNQRTWIRSGVLSKSDQGSPDHRSVNNLKERNPFPINRFNVGHIALYTASKDDREIDMKYVKNPQHWKSEIRTYIRSEQEGSSKDEQLLG